jgi:hypothetical protein
MLRLDLRLDPIIDEVLREYNSATATHGPFNSAHEGYAVLDEERDELWDEVKKRNHNKVAMRREAVQVAAMALRFIVDCTEE